MRKGRSVVLEEDHTLILGWSDTVFTVLSELEIANESRKQPSAVVLADRDKVEMDDLIREKVRPKRTRASSPAAARRSTSATSTWSGPEKARSIVVLSPEDEEEPDAQVIKTILALTKGTGTATSIPHRRRDPRPGQPQRGPPGQRRRSGADRQARDDRQAGRPLGAPVRRLGRLHRAARLQRRRDLLPRGRGPGRPQLRRGPARLRGLLGDRGDRRRGPGPAQPAAERPIEAGEQLVAIAADDTALAGAGPRVPARSTTTAIVSAPPAEPRARRASWCSAGTTGRPAVIREFDKFLLDGSGCCCVTDEAEAGRASSASAPASPTPGSSAATEARPRSRRWRRSGWRTSTT